MATQQVGSFADLFTPEQLEAMGLGQAQDIAGNGGKLPQAPTNAWNAAFANNGPSTEADWIEQARKDLTAGGASNQGTINALTHQSTTTGTQNAATLQQIRDAIASQGQSDANYITQSQGIADQFTGLANGANAFDWGALGTYQTGLNGIQTSNQGILDNYGGVYQSLMQPLTSSVSYNPLTSQAAVADPQALQAQYASLAQLQGISNGSLDYSSQAAQAHASQQAIQNQYNAYGQLVDVGNGALNYTSQGASTYANNEDINNQKSAAATLQNTGQGGQDVDIFSLPGIYNLKDAANGGLDVDPNSLQGMNALHDAYQSGTLDVNPYAIPGFSELMNVSQGSQDLYFPNQPGVNQLSDWMNGYHNVNLDDVDGIDKLRGATEGSQDVHVGQEDPGAYAAQQEALAKYKDLTDPTVTSSEEFIYKQAQLQQEQDERANRAANLTNLRQRGLSGAGAEIGQAALASQTTSQNRLLADLGAQKQAVDRSMAALQGYGALSTDMSQEGDQIAQQNALNRLNAIGQYSGYGVDVAQQNAANQLNATNAYTGYGIDVNQQNVANRLNALGQYSTIGANTLSDNMGRRANALSQYAGTEADLETANSNRQLQAEQSYTGLGADIATSNADRRVQGQQAAYAAYSDLRSQGFTEAESRAAAADTASQFNSEMMFNGRVQASNASANIRNAEFDEAYKRGVGADNASANNQSTRLGGSIAAGNQANTLQSDAFKRGTAADQTAQFNETNRLGVDEFNTTFAQKERDATWDRTNDFTTNSLRGNEDQTALLNLGYQAGKTTNQDTFNRSRAALGSQDDVFTRQNTLSGQQTNRNIVADTQEIGLGDDTFNRALQLGGLSFQNQGTQTSGNVAIDQLRAGGAAAQQARNLAIGPLTTGGSPIPDSVAGGLNGGKGFTEDGKQYNAAGHVIPTDPNRKYDKNGDEIV